MFIILRQSKPKHISTILTALFILSIAGGCCISEGADSVMHTDSGNLASNVTITDIGLSETPSRIQPEERNSPYVSESAPPASQTTAPESAYKSVLNNDTEMLDAHTGECATLAQMIGQGSEIKLFVSKFTVIDLDNDGGLEVVLELCKNSDPDQVVAYSILRYQDGVVYQFSLPLRGFMDLKTDGTFMSSGGAGDVRICTISFDKSEYITDEFTYCQSYNNPDGTWGESYFVKHQSATEEEWNAAFDQWEKTAYVVWYDFTITNIDVALD